MKIKVRSGHIGQPKKLKIKKVGPRSIAILLSSLLVVGVGFSIYASQQEDSSATSNMLNLSDMVKINPDYEQYLLDVEAGKASEYELIPNKYIPAENNSKSAPATRMEEASPSLPAKFNLIEEGYGTRIKDQGIEGICWAYTLTSAAESYLKRNNIADIEFSPKQMDYLFLEGTPHANYVSSLGRSVHSQLGGGYNFSLASTYFLDGLTPVKEVDFFARLQKNDSSLQPYSSWDQYTSNRHIYYLLGVNEEVYNKPMSYSEVIGDKNDYIITEYSNIYVQDINLNKIKESIYRNGGAYVGTIGPDEPGAEACYDESTKTIIDKGTALCGKDNGHAMLAVGWDDNYKYKDPVDNSTKTGAFILQNSWGTSDLFKKYGIQNFDSLVQLGIFKTENVSEEKIEKINKIIREYDALETVYLGYESSNYSKAATHFATIKKMETNDYAKIYSPTITKNFDGVYAGDKGNEIVFKYHTDNRDQIGSVAVSRHFLSASRPFNYDLFIDSGNGYKKIGNVESEINSIDSQKVIKLTSPVQVSGTFYLKLSIKASDTGEDVGVRPEERKYFSMSAFSNERIDPNPTPVDPTPNTPTDPTDPDTPTDPTEPDTPTEDPTEPDTPTYTGKVTWLQGKDYIIGEGEDLIVKIDYPLDMFVSIKLDNKKLDEKNYRLTSGSTVITIPHAYLDTLEEGKHKLAVAFTNNETINLEFTVSEELPVPNTGADTSSTTSPNTGVNTKGKGDALAILSFALPAIFILSFAGYGIRRNKKHVSFNKK